MSKTRDVHPGVFCAGFLDIGAVVCGGRNLLGFIQLPVQQHIIHALGKNNGCMVIGYLTRTNISGSQVPLTIYPMQRVS